MERKINIESKAKKNNIERKNLGERINNNKKRNKKKYKKI